MVRDQEVEGSNPFAPTTFSLIFIGLLIMPLLSPEFVAQISILEARYRIQIFSLSLAGNQHLPKVACPYLTARITANLIPPKNELLVQHHAAIVTGWRDGESRRRARHRARSGGRRTRRHFTVAATAMICFSMEARRSLGSMSACSRVFHAAVVRSAVSTAICQSGLAGILAVSAKRRIWSGVISE